MNFHAVKSRYLVASTASHFINGVIMHAVSNGTLNGKFETIRPKNSHSSQWNTLMIGHVEIGCGSSIYMLHERARSPIYIHIR